MEDRVKQVRDNIIDDVKDWDGEQPIVFRRLSHDGPHGIPMWYFWKSDKAKELQFMKDEAEHALKQLPPTEQYSLLQRLGFDLGPDHEQERGLPPNEEFGNWSEHIRYINDKLKYVEQRNANLCENLDTAEMRIKELEARIKELEHENSRLKEWIIRKVVG